MGGDILTINLGGSTAKWTTWPSACAHHPEAIRAARSPRSRSEFHKLLVEMRDAAPGIGKVVLGFPGPIDSCGRVSVACTLWPGDDLADFELKAALKAVWPGAGVRVVNDVTGYGRFLLSTGLTDFCVLNLGSGIGCKLYVRGAEVVGPFGRGGEIGHWVAGGSYMHLRCDCGGKGHLGALASGRGVLQLSGLSTEQARDIGADAFVTDVRQGNPSAGDTLRSAMTPLAHACALIHLVTGCEKFVLVGGFAQALSDVLPGLLGELTARFAWQNGFDWSSAYCALPEEVTSSLVGLRLIGEESSDE